jgi:phenylalanyl-tRNA synthetase alpha chain
MSDKITEVQQAALRQSMQAKTLAELNEVKVQYLGKKGEIQALMSEMRALPKEEKPALARRSMYASRKSVMPWTKSSRSWKSMRQLPMQAERNRYDTAGRY